MSQTTRKTARLVQYALLMALLAVLGFTPLGFIMVPPVSITILHIPVILGAVLFGPGCGALLGFEFGLISMVRAIMAPTPPIDMLFSPAASGAPVQSIVHVHPSARPARRDRGARSSSRSKSSSGRNRLPRGSRRRPPPSATRSGCSAACGISSRPCAAPGLFGHRGRQRPARIGRRHPFDGAHLPAAAEIPQIGEVSPVKEIAITEIENLKIGCAQDPEAATGCTVLLCERGAPAGRGRARRAAPLPRKPAFYSPPPPPRAPSRCSCRGAARSGWARRTA